MNEHTASLWSCTMCMAQQLHPHRKRRMKAVWSLHWHSVVCIRSQTARSHSKNGLWQLCAVLQCLMRYCSTASSTRPVLCPPVQYAGLQNDKWWPCPCVYCCVRPTAWCSDVHGRSGTRSGTRSMRVLTTSSDTQGGEGLQKAGQAQHLIFRWSASSMLLGLCWWL